MRPLRRMGCKTSQAEDLDEMDTSSKGGRQIHPGSSGMSLRHLIRTSVLRRLTAQAGGGDEITIQSQAPQRPKPSRGSCLGRIRMVGRALIRCVHHFHGSFLLARSGGPCAKDLRSGKEGDLAPEGRGGGRDLESPQIIM